MRLTFLETFLAGVGFGIGLTVLTLYAQKPRLVAMSLERMADRGRARRDKEEENKFLKKRLKEMGFSDEEISESL